ncbi:PAS domain-containing protein [bacterium]|nr:PAS domain-containing protein [bacterium]
MALIICSKDEQMGNVNTRLELSKSGLGFTDNNKWRDAVLEHIGVACFTKDRDRRYTFVNALFCDLVGVCGNDIIGQGDEDLGLGFPCENNEKDDIRVLKGEFVHLSNVRFPGVKDLLYDIRLNPVYDSDGEVSGICGIIKEINGEIKIAGDLFDSQKEYTITTMVSRIAHDFNNYIYGVTGMATLALENAVGNEVITSDLEKILEITEKMGGYIKKLVSLGVKDSIKMQRESLKDVVKGVVSLVIQIFPNDIIIDTTYPEDECFVLIDRRQVEVAILNILINSKKAINKDGKIFVSLKREEEIIKNSGLKYLSLEISDNGCGMAAEVKDKSLNPFFTTHAGKGAAGFGLTIASEIIENNGGNLLLNTSNGEETSVDIRFPSLN